MLDELIREALGTIEEPMDELSWEILQAEWRDRA